MAEAKPWSRRHTGSDHQRVSMVQGESRDSRGRFMSTYIDISRASEQPMHGLATSRGGHGRWKGHVTVVHHMAPIKAVSIMCTTHSLTAMPRTQLQQRGEPLA